MRNFISVGLIGLCIVATSGVAWGQLYWNTNGTAANWTAANWGTSSSGPFTTAWTNNTNTIFTANSTVTFVSTSIGNVTVADGVTVTLTQAGTLSTNSSVRTFNVGTGSTLTWTGQAVSNNSTSGFTKTGSGIWNIGAQANSYTGGFALNDGTVIVTGAKSFGTAAMTINGGTIQSSTAITYAATSLTIGGNFTLSGTGNDVWGMNVDLGSSTRTITNSTTGVSSRTYSGIISGSAGVGLTFNGGGSGTMILSGANTYTGLTTVSSGILQLNRSGGTTIPITNNVTVSGGTLRISTDQTVNDLTVASGATLTVDAGVTLTVNGTYSVFSSTSGNAGTITVNGTLQINQGGWPGNTGTFTYGASGILAFANSSGSYGVGATDTWWPSSGGPANVTVSGAGGITMNVARTVSGTFQTAAGVTTANNLTLNGIAQINSGGYFTGSPTFGGSSTLIYNTGGTYGRGAEWNSSSNPGKPNNVQLSNSTTINYPNGGGAIALNIANLTIDAGSSLYMDYGNPGTGVGILTVTGNLTMNGNLSLGNQAGGDLKVGGNWMKGAGAFAPNSRLVEFNGVSAQSITGATTFDYLTINNSSTGVSLSNVVTVNNALTFTAGTLTLGTNILTLSGTIGGTPVAGNCIVTDNTGTVARSIAAGGSFQFPVGPASTGYNPLTIALNAGDPTEIFNVRVISSISPASGDDAVAIQRTWRIDETTPGGNNATLTFGWTVGDQGGSFSSGVQPYAYPHNGSIWTSPVLMTLPSLNSGLYTSSTTSTVSLFSPWLVASAGALPIQLSSFTGTVVNSRVKLNWTTASEVNNYGFYVQKRAVGVLEWWSVDGSFVAGHGTTNLPQQYTFTDNAAFTSALQYRLKQVDLDGSIHFTDPIQVDAPTSVREVAPIAFALNQNYPNPFNPETNIRFSVEQTGRATLDLHNMLGQKVLTLFDGEVEAGYYKTVRLDGSNLASGVYLYRLQSKTNSDFKKLVLMK